MSEDELAIDALYSALADQDRTTLRLLLHPYLHWTTPDGTVVRGRSKVLALLDELTEPPQRPVTVELRDGQIYRWQSALKRAR